MILLPLYIEARRRKSVRPGPHIGPVPFQCHWHLPKIGRYERLLKRADIKAFAGIMLAVHIAVLENPHAAV